MKGVLGLGLFLAVAASSDDTRNPSSVAADEEPKRSTCRIPNVLIITPN